MRRRWKGQLGGKMRTYWPSLLQSTIGTEDEPVACEQNRLRHANPGPLPRRAPQGAR